MTPPLSAFPPAPPNASTCPKCNTPAQPSPSLQTCRQCGRQFVLRFGALMDASITLPPPDPSAKELKLKAPGLVVVSQAVLKPDAIGFGALDPILGRFPMDEKGVRFAHLYSIALWRELNVAQVVMFFIVSLPVGLFSIVGIIASKGAPGGFICGVPFVLLAAFHAYRVFSAKATRLRVVGFKDRTLDVTFTGGLGKRRKFVDELFHRCGLAPVEMP